MLTTRGDPFSCLREGKGKILGTKGKPGDLKEKGGEKRGRLVGHGQSGATWKNWIIFGKGVHHKKGRRNKKKRGGPPGKRNGDRERKGGKKAAKNGTEKSPSRVPDSFLVNSFLGKDLTKEGKGS